VGGGTCDRVHTSQAARSRRPNPRAVAPRRSPPSPAHRARPRRACGRRAPFVGLPPPTAALRLTDLPHAISTFTLQFADAAVYPSTDSNSCSINITATRRCAKLRSPRSRSRCPTPQLRSPGNS